MKTYNQPITELLSVEPHSELLIGSPMSGDYGTVGGGGEGGPGSGD